MMTIAEKVKDLRVKRNWRQEYVANELEISQSTYSALENGTSKLTVERAEALAELHGIDPTYFFSKIEVHINVGKHSNSHTKIRSYYNDSSPIQNTGLGREIDILKFELTKINDKIDSLFRLKNAPNPVFDLGNNYIWKNQDTNTDMAQNIVLETLMENYKFSKEEVATETGIELEVLEGLIDGTQPMTIKYAEKLGKHFSVKGELFFRQSAESTHINIGDKANSSSGVVTYYNGDTDKELVNRLDVENKQLKAKIAKLEKLAAQRGK